MELSYAKIYNFNQRAMTFNRSHPDIPKDMKWVLTFGLMYGIYASMSPIFLYSFKSNIDASDFIKACEDATFLVVFSFVSFLYFIMVWKRNILQEIIRSIERDYVMSKYLNLEQQKTILKYAKTGGLIGNQWFLTSSTILCAFYLKNWYFYLKNLVNGKFELIPAYKITYPGLIDESNSIQFISLYLMIGNFGAYSGSMYTSFIPLGPSFMLHACGQLEILAKRMEKLFVNRNEEEMVLELKNIIINLQSIYSFVNKINECFRVAYDISFKGIVIFLPVVFFAIIETFRQGRLSMEFISFFGGGVLMISTPCYYSELLMEKGENFRLAAYSCGWERFYDRRTRITIALILQRAIRPVVIQTTFRIVSLDALAEVFHQSYALFSLMNAVWN